jgi:hypothetical protein
MTRIEQPARGTGRTSRMIQALPAQNTPTVVVHTQAMADHVRNLARQLRPDLRHPIRVRIVRDTRDCDYLRGVRFVVDHAMLEHVSPEVRDLLRAMDRLPRINYAPPGRGRG